MKHKRLKPAYFVLLLVFFLLVPSLIAYAGGSKALQAKLDECSDEKDKLEAQVSQLESDNQSLKSQLESLEARKAALESKIAQLEGRIAEKEGQIEAIEQEAPDPSIVSVTKEQIQQVEAEIIELKMKKGELEESIQQINREIAQLKSENYTLKSENNTMKSENNTLESENHTLQVNNTMLSTRIQQITEEKEELEMALRVYEGIQKESMQLMEFAIKRIHELLREEIRTGKVRVFKGQYGIVLDVVSEYMFETGSVEINYSSKNILSKIALLLNELDGYFIGVLGNADSKPIITPSLKEKYSTNWELASARGATVTRYLLEKSKISPSRMVAMGLGEFWPIDDNDSEKGRGNNRRVDIILLPVDVVAAIVVGAEIK